MRIEELDQNLAVETTIEEPDLVWLDAKSAPFALYGVFYDEKEGRYLRMPNDAALEVSKRTWNLSQHTAGGRIRFCTDSPVIAISVKTENAPLMSHITLVGQSGFDLYRKTEKGDLFYRSFVPPRGMSEGYSSLAKLEAGFYEYTINFPLYDKVEELYVALKAGARLEPAQPYRNPLPIVYYGSSITQGGCASRPGNSYQAIIGRQLNMDHINLGFSGNAKGELAMARYIGTLSMSAFVCDFDHNCVTVEQLQAAHEPFVRTVRQAQPTLPIVLVTAPDILLKGSRWTAGREVIRKTFARMIAEGDENLYFVDGATLFEGDFWDSCTVDGTHPNDFGFARMARGIIKPLKEIFPEF